MHSIINLKIKGIDYHTGNKVSINSQLKVDGINFKDRTMPKLKINGGKYELPETIFTAQEQADDYVSTQNDFLKGIIHDPAKELSCILDWKVVSIENFTDEKQVITIVPYVEKPKKFSDVEKFDIIFSAMKEGGRFEGSEGFRDAFFHTYSEMAKHLTGLKFDKKLKITLASMGVGLQAASVAYQNMIDVYKKPLTKEIRDKAQLKGLERATERID